MSLKRLDLNKLSFYLQIDSKRLMSRLVLTNSCLNIIRPNTITNEGINSQ